MAGTSSLQFARLAQARKKQMQFVRNRKIEQRKFLLNAYQRELAVLRKLVDNRQEFFCLLSSFSDNSSLCNFQIQLQQNEKSRTAIEKQWWRLRQLHRTNVLTGRYSQSGPIHADQQESCTNTDSTGK